MRHSPLDHDRYIENESVQDAAQRPGLVVVGVAVVAVVVCVATFALGKAGAGVAAAIVAMLAFGAGLSWLGMGRRRIRQSERDWAMRQPAQ